MRKSTIVLIMPLLCFLSCRTSVTGAKNDAVVSTTAAADHKSEDSSHNIPISRQGKEGKQFQEVNLMEIGNIAPKGRVQDKEYNPNLRVVEELIAQGVDSIPFLIKKLEDETELPKPVVSFWSKVTVGDIALIILTDLFTKEDCETATIPEVSWNKLLEVDQSNQMSAEEALRSFIQRHGRKAIKTKWANIWEKNKDRIFWDQTSRCFKLK